MELLEEINELLQDLKRCGSFYYSAIELDIHTENFINGEELEKRINKLLHKINSYEQKKLL